jgi:hypothetical protein
VRAMVCLFARASSAVQAHGNGPPATRSRKQNHGDLLKPVVGSAVHER